MAGSIFLIDDDSTIVDSLLPVLAREGYRLECARPGGDALHRVSLARPDLVVLGVSSEEHGWQFCRHVLAVAEWPVMLLLSSGSEMDRVQGLDLGADDCLLKPFLVLEFIARVRALLRRDTLHGSRSSQGFFVDGALAVDMARREVRLNGSSVPLSATEYRMLACFVQHAGQILSPERLIALIWGESGGGSVDHVKLYVYHLRHKLEPDPAHPTRIVTRRGEGYIFNRLGSSDKQQEQRVIG